jgi:hypothetical protein
MKRKDKTRAPLHLTPQQQEAMNDLIRQALTDIRRGSPLDLVLLEHQVRLDKFETTPRAQTSTPSAPEPPPEAPQEFAAERAQRLGKLDDYHRELTAQHLLPPNTKVVKTVPEPIQEET